MREIIHKKLILSTVSLLFLMNYSCSYLPGTFDAIEGISITETEKYIELDNGQQATTGIIFYPGGLVDAHAYIPLFSNEQMLSLPVKSVIVKMPLNLAVFDVNEAKNVIDQFPNIERWFIAGHSLGGAMACTAVNNNEDLFDGMMLMAAYPASSVDLSDWSGKVVSIRGSNDLLTTQEDLDDTKNQLPANTDYFTIDGGNHAGFGVYGVQKNDGENELNSPSQIDITVEQMINFIL